VVIAALASVLWLVFVYSLAFGDGGAAQPWIGGLHLALLADVGPGAVRADTTLPETVFFMFQMTFAIITPALIVGAYVERIKFAAVVLFSGLWLLIVYAPVTHWVWGGGWLARLGVLDFAGGIVVHATAGISALVFAWVLGPRRGFPHELIPPHSLPLTVAGAGMLWVGWFGFNAGSALAANGSAGMAMLATHMGAASGALAWMFIEWKHYGKPSTLGIVTGMVAGLGTITPASGFVGPLGAVVIGLSAGTVCYFATQFLKRKLEIDDSLDVSPVHGVGGVIGTLLTGVFGAVSLGGSGFPVQPGIGAQLGVQALGVVAAIAWCGGITWVILKLTSLVFKLRVSEEKETEGLDLAEHGERGYSLL
jgi:Amt family ammonium transporter